LAKPKSAPASNIPEPEAGYIVVARRYRPKGFGELVGQGHVGQALRNAIETNRVGHAYLFTGARGVGKTSTARIFAKALNNPGGPSAEFDPQTDIAAAIDAGEDVDVIEIDGASNRGIDEIRSLRANVGVRPSRARFKIYIIDEVHMLTGAAFNALLKTLEEPPEHVKFIFCTTDPEKIPITVLSRCQRFDFAPVEVSEIIGRLKEIVAGENASADDEALELIARRASGSMRDSQSLLEQVMSFSDGKLTADNVHSMLGTADDERLLALSKAMADRDAAASLAMLDAAIDEGVDAGRLAEQLLGYFRDLLAVTVGCDASLQRHTALSMHAELKALGDRWGLQTVLAVVGLIDQTLVRIRHSVYGRVLLEATLIQICHLPDLQAIADLAAAGPMASVEKKKISRTESPPNSLRPPLNHQNPVASGKSVAPVESVEPLEPKVAQSQSASSHLVDSQPINQDSTKSVSTNSKSTGVWDAIEIESRWKSVIEALPEMTAAMIRVAEKADASRSGIVQIIFPSESALAMKRCEQVEHRDAIIAAIAQQCGHAARIEFVTAPPKARPVAEKPVAQRANRIQRTREIEASPLVQSCLEQFGAQIVKVDFPS
jgi:DNA polymerase III subunit gamma/tau